jgi:predicted TIM-barrel fold metal-dependent hydrolase
VTGLSQVVLGTDHPYGDPLNYVLDLRELQTAGVLTAEDRQNIERNNAARLVASVKT